MWPSWSHQECDDTFSIQTLHCRCLRLQSIHLYDQLVLMSVIIAQWRGKSFTILDLLNLSCHAQISWLSRIIIHWNRHIYICWISVIATIYIAIYSKPQKGRLITRIHITESSTFLRLDITRTWAGRKGRTASSPSINGPQRNPSTNIRRWWEFLTFPSPSANPAAWASARALDVPIGDPTCCCLRGNFHKEPPRVDRHWRRSWRQSLCRSITATPVCSG